MLQIQIRRPDRDLCILVLPGNFHGYYPGWQNDFVNPTLYTAGAESAQPEQRRHGDVAVE